MPTNKMLGKPVTEVLLVLSEKKGYLTYTNIVDAYLTNEWKRKIVDKDRKSEKWLKTRRRFIQAIKRIKNIEAETACRYVEKEGRTFRIHDGACSQKRACIILLEFHRLCAAEDEVKREDFEKRIYEKYKSIEKTDEWSPDFIAGKMKAATENFYVKLEDGKYKILPRLERDLDLMIKLVGNYQNKRASKEVKKKLMRLL